MYGGSAKTKSNVLLGIVFNIFNELPLTISFKNFGYGTNDHLRGLKKYGVTKHHRKKFSPVHKMLISKTRETQ